MHGSNYQYVVYLSNFSSFLSKSRKDPLVLVVVVAGSRRKVVKIRNNVSSPHPHLLGVAVAVMV